MTELNKLQIMREHEEVCDKIAELENKKRTYDRILSGDEELGVEKFQDVWVRKLADVLVKNSVRFQDIVKYRYNSRIVFSMVASKINDLLDEDQENLSYDIMDIENGDNTGRTYRDLSKATLNLEYSECSDIDLRNDLGFIKATYMLLSAISVFSRLEANDGEFMPLFDGLNLYLEEYNQSRQDFISSLPFYNYDGEIEYCEKSLLEIDSKIKIMNIYKEELSLNLKLEES